MSDMTDREAYPAAWVVGIALAAAFLLWKYGLGAPTVSGCWIWTHWHIYCPGCGGTRSVIALAQGHFLQALYYHPAVPVIAVTGSTYFISQTIWRIRGRKGWVLHYHPRWPGMLVGLFVANCALRNLLWIGFGKML
ncbi:DUF2752 domain-containing protein [Dysosmobacter sp.]